MAPRTNKSNDSTPRRISRKSIVEPDGLLKKELNQTQYTSSGFKLLRHEYAIKRAINGFGTPIVLQIAPTAKCNQKCAFCFHRGRSMGDDLDISRICDIIGILKQIGLRCVELTGGGEPLLYPSQHMGFLRGFLWACAVGFNTSTVEKRVGFGKHTMYDYMHWLWNNPRSGQSPYALFGGVFKPISKDVNGDLVYALGKGLGCKKEI